MLRLSIYCTLVSSPRHEIKIGNGFGSMFTYQRCRILQGRIAVRGLKDEMDGGKGGASGQSWDPGLEIEVPFEQRPVNEYSSLKEATLYSWADLDPGSFFLRLGGLWLVTFTVLGVPIAAASFNLSKDPLRFFLAAGTGTLFLVSLVVLRIYLVNPVIKLLKQTLVGTGVLLVTAVSLFIFATPVEEFIQKTFVQENQSNGSVDVKTDDDLAAAAAEAAEGRPVYISESGRCFFPCKHLQDPSCPNCF